MLTTAGITFLTSGEKLGSAPTKGELAGAAVSACAQELDTGEAARASATPAAKVAKRNGCFGERGGSEDMAG
jgi:hypothetical protein